MKNANRIYLIWGIRIVVSILFILSAVAKLYPSPLMGISSFETKYLGAIGIQGDLSKVISRLLIGFEFTLGIFLLLPFYLKKVVIPTTILLLGAFSLHLSFQVFQGLSETVNHSCVMIVVLNIHGVANKKTTEVKNIICYAIHVSIFLFLFLRFWGVSTQP